MLKSPLKKRMQRSKPANYADRGFLACFFHYGSKISTMKKLSIIIAAITLFASCASTSQLKQLEIENASLRAEKTNYISRTTELETNITDLKKSIAGLNDRIALLTNENTALGQQTADQQSKLNQDQVVLQVAQERLERLEKLLVIERAKSDDSKNRPNQVPSALTSN